MGFDKIIDNGTLVLEGGCLNISLAIKDGKIAVILQDGCGADGKERIDAEERYISPGGIGTHTHFLDSGVKYREDWEYGTKAAVPGGHTLVMEMSNSSPPVTDKDAFRTKYERASQYAVVDFALWGGAIAGGNGHIGGLRGLGCIASKGFTLDAGPEFKWLDHQQQRDTMDEVKEYRRILGLHAEDENIISGLKERFQDGPRNLRFHDMARPWYAEMIAVQNAVILSKVSGCPLHICHLSILEGAEPIKKVKTEGVDMSVESCTHYFLLNHEDNFGAGTCGPIQLPSRDRKRMEQVWEYLLNGIIDYLDTDHALYTKEGKEPEDGGGQNITGGVPSVDIAYPLMIFRAVIKRGVRASRLAGLHATSATKCFGLYLHKGVVRVGTDADPALMDMDCRWNYSRKDSLSKTKCTSFPYEGKEVLRRVTETLVRGRTVYGDGTIWVVPGSGIFIKPQKGAIEMLGINKGCLWEHLQYIGGIRVDPRGGVSRFAWTPVYRGACEVLMGWMREVVLTVWMDTVGNIYGKLEEQEDLPPILTGSHSDTVPMGGKFDGLAGAMAALEVLTILSESGIKPRRPIEVIAFVSGEASQLLGGYFGSKAICGMLSEDYAVTSTDRVTGTTMRQAMLDFDMGLEPDNFPGSYIKAGDYYASIELHIERGCYLLHEDLPMAVVTGITGIKQFHITLHGVSAHAGDMTTEGRHDAMAAVAAIACEVERLVLESGSTTRRTVGYIEALPAEHNIVANQAIVPVDFREKEDDLWQKLHDDLMAFVEKQCGDRGLICSVRSTVNTEPVYCDKRFVELIEQCIGKEEIPHKYMVSYPAHDVMQMGRLYPMEMIFLRNPNGGVSHCPDEYTTPEDMADGTAVLPRTVKRLAQEDLLG